MPSSAEISPDATKNRGEVRLLRDFRPLRKTASSVKISSMPFFMQFGKVYCADEVIHDLYALLAASIGFLSLICGDMNSRHFLLRGSVKVQAEWLLYSLALNILRLHHKMQNKRLGSGRVVPEQSLPVFDLLTGLSDIQLGRSRGWLAALALILLFERGCLS